MCYAYWHPSCGTDYRIFVFKFNENCSFFQLFQKKIKHFKKFSRLCSNFVWGYLQSYFFLFVLPCAWVPCAYVFFWRTKICPSHSGIRQAIHLQLQVMTFRRFYVVCFERLHIPVTCVLGVLEGWNFLCIVTPSWGADHQNFNKKFDEKKFFFCLISPTHFPAYNSCSKGPRCLKFVMRIDSPHAGPTTTFLFQNSTKIVHFFEKKYILKLVLISPTHYPAYNLCSKCPRGLKFVMRIHAPHAGPNTTFLFLNLTKIVHFFNFFKKSF